MDNEDRKMFQGEWKCGTCDGAITQLPFEPDPSRLGGLKCSDCHKKGADNNSEKKMFKGEWKCSKCSGEITQLPFEPDPSRTDGLVCFDCYKNK